jgi:hypothetical protein
MQLASDEIPKRRGVGCRSLSPLTDAEVELSDLEPFIFLN